MKNNPIIELVVVTLLGVLALTTVWEFFLEPLFNLTSSLGTEPLTEKLEFIIDGVLSAGIAMMYPVILLRRNLEQREHAETSLRESEKRLRMFTDAMPALFSYVDKEQRYRFCNLAYEKHFRKTATRSSARPFRSFSAQTPINSSNRYLTGPWPGKPFSTNSGSIILTPAEYLSAAA